MSMEQDERWLVGYEQGSHYGTGRQDSYSVLGMMSIVDTYESAWLGGDLTVTPWYRGWVDAVTDYLLSLEPRPLP